MFKAFRLAASEKSLRQQCAELGLDTGNISNMEMGAKQPPLTPGRLKELCERFEFTPLQFERLKAMAYDEHLSKLKKRWGAE